MTGEVKEALRFEGPGLVVCVGNPLRGDDGAGPFIADRCGRAFSERERAHSEERGRAQRYATRQRRSQSDAGGPAPTDVHPELLNVINAETTPENHIDEIIAMNPPVVVFIDAADFGGQPGEARVIPREAISDYALSTHGFPLGALCELIRQSIRADIRFVGIQVKSCSLGEGMCGEVGRAAEEIAAELCRRKSPK